MPKVKSQEIKNLEAQAASKMSQIDDLLSLGRSHLRSKLLNLGLNEATTVQIYDHTVEISTNLADPDRADRDGMIIIILPTFDTVLNRGHVPASMSISATSQFDPIDGELNTKIQLSKLRHAQIIADNFKYVAAICNVASLEQQQMLKQIGEIQLRLKADIEKLNQK